MKLSISPKRLFRTLVECTVILTFLSLVVLMIGYYTGHQRLMGIGTLFNEGAEMNIPTWYSSITLMFCSVLLWLIASAKAGAGERYARHWRFLSVAFALASADEVTSTHSMMGDIMQRLFKSGFLNQVNWTAPMAVFALIFAAAYIRFLLHLPRGTRNLFLLAGALFVGGSIGLEALGGIWRTFLGENDLPYIIMLTLEEGVGEMLGVAIFAYALSAYIARHMPGLEIQFSDEAATEVVSQSESDVVSMPQTEVRASE